MLDDAKSFVRTVTLLASTFVTRRTSRICTPLRSSAPSCYQWPWCRTLPGGKCCGLPATLPMATLLLVAINETACHRTAHVALHGTAHAPGHLVRKDLRSYHGDHYTRAAVSDAFGTHLAAHLAFISVALAKWTTPPGEVPPAATSEGAASDKDIHCQHVRRCLRPAFPASRITCVAISALIACIASTAHRTHRTLHTSRIARVANRTSYAPHSSHAYRASCTSLAFRIASDALHPTSCAYRAHGTCRTRRPPCPTRAHRAQRARTS